MNKTIEFNSDTKEYSEKNSVNGEYYIGTVKFEVRAENKDQAIDIIKGVISKGEPEIELE